MIDVKLQPHEHEGHRNATISSREGFWYPEPCREMLLAELHALTTDPPRHRTRSIAIIAEANGGKSRVAKRYMELHAPVEHEDATAIQAIFVNMTKYARVEDLSERLLKEIGAPKLAHETHTQRMERFIGLASKNRMLIFLDEFHDCADTSGKGKPFLRLIKNLLLEGLLVIPMGTEELAAVLADDPQLASRLNFATGRLPRVDNLETLKSLMLKVIRLPESKIEDEAIQYVREQSKGVLGHVLDLTEGTYVAHHNLELASLKQYRLKMDALDSVA